MIAAPLNFELRETLRTRAVHAAAQLAAGDQLARRRRELLAETAARLLAGQNPDRDVMPALYHALAAERIADATLGYTVTDYDEVMRLGFMEGFDPEMIQRSLTLDFGQAICGRVVVTRKAMHVTDIQNTLDPMADLVRSAGIDTYACEPLIVGGRLLGTLSFASRSRHRFDPGDLIFFRAIAKHVAMARDRARKAELHAESSILETDASQRS